MSFDHMTKSFIDGLGNIEVQEKGKKMRNKKSKLVTHSDLLKKYWFEGKSLEFMRLRLAINGVSCARSTILRFMKKSFSL